MVLVEKSSFWMGDTWADGGISEGPVHNVVLSYDFYIGKYLVTFDDYDAFCKATGRSEPKDEGWGRGSRPVINVSWWDAVGYCNWLSKKEGLQVAYDNKGNLLDNNGNFSRNPSKTVGYRLPTEEEWEYAAAGGNKSFGYKYSGSDDLDEIAWYCKDSDGMPHEVGTKAPNELGIYDMSGNVWEWVEFDSKGGARFKGGCFFDAEISIVGKVVTEKNYASNDVGFRIVKTAFVNSEPFSPTPYNGASEQKLSLTLSWYGNEESCFDVYLGTKDDKKALFASRITRRYVELINLNPDTNYYWKVVEKRNDGHTIEGRVWTFRTASDLSINKPSNYEGKNEPPIAPYNPSPPDEAVVGALTVTLIWDSYSPKYNALTYDIYLDTNTNPMTKASSYQVDNSLKISNLSYNKTYYWKVVAKDERGRVTEGPVWEFTTCDIKPTLVLVEKGCFTIKHSFYIGKYEATFSEYDAFCNATGKSKPDDVGWGRGARPIINVSWWDAIDYCDWLSDKEKLPKAYDNNGNLLDKDGKITTDPFKVVGYRLPTEAEWEYAARGGNKSKGYEYSGSDTVNDVAWYWDNSGRMTQEVGKKVPNELGIYDMSGNVWEMCSDWYGDYFVSSRTDLYKGTAGSSRVIRGGSWGISATYVRVAFRVNFSPTGACNYLGFRIARTVP